MAQHIAGRLFGDFKQVAAIAIEFELLGQDRLGLEEARMHAIGDLEHGAEIITAHGPPGDIAELDHHPTSSHETTRTNWRGSHICQKRGTLTSRRDP
ncbi:hypothetical protein D9M68_932900 [compost metagenome]